MWWAVRQLLVPMNYLRIRHGTGLFHSKRVYDWILPIVFSSAICLIFYWLGIELSLFAQQDLSKRLIDLLVLMIVFYMAALAAVSTFDRDGIDSPLKDEDALLDIYDSVSGEHKDKKLSYRSFISYLFGYLSFLSLILYVFIVAMSVIWPVVEKHFEANILAKLLLSDVADPLIFFVVFGLVSQLIITSMLGIYFLTERIQTLNDHKN